MHTLAAPRTDQVSQPPHGVILGQLVQYAGLAQARQDMPSVLVFLLGNAGLCPIQEHLSRDSLLLAEAINEALRSSSERDYVISGHQRSSEAINEAHRRLKQTAADARRLFPQNLESRAEDNYPVPDYPDRPDRPVSACA